MTKPLYQPTCSQRLVLLAFSESASNGKQRFSNDNLLYFSHGEGLWRLAGGPSPAAYSYIHGRECGLRVNVLDGHVTLGSNAAEQQA